MNIDCNSSSRKIYFVYRYQPSEISIVEKCMVITDHNPKYLDRVKYSNGLYQNNGRYSMNIDCISSRRKNYYVYRY